MSRKNYKVATASDGKTTLTKIDKTPTGKVKTIKDRDKIRKEREEQYKNFRLGALERRAKRMGLSEQEIKKKKEELLSQLDTPNSYDVLVLFSAKDYNLVKEALKNEGLVYKMMSNSHVWMVADQETLKTIREIMPPSAKIHPYVKKKPAILPAAPTKTKKKQPKKGGKPHSSLQSKKTVGKRHNIARLSKKKKVEFKKQVKSLRDLWKANKKKAGTTVQLDPKKASTNLKKAA